MPAEYELKNQQQIIYKIALITYNEVINFRSIVITKNTNNFTNEFKLLDNTNDLIVDIQERWPNRYLYSDRIRGELTMNQLTNSRTVINASHDDIVKYIVPALEQTFNDEKEYEYFKDSKEEINPYVQPSRLKLYYDINNPVDMNEIECLKAGIYDGLQNNTTNTLNLNNDEEFIYITKNETKNGHKVTYDKLVVLAPGKFINFGTLAVTTDPLNKTNTYVLLDNYGEPVTDSKFNEYYQITVD